MRFHPSCSRCPMELLHSSAAALPVMLLTTAGPGDPCWPIYVTHRAAQTCLSTRDKPLTILLLARNQQLLTQGPGFLVGRSPHKHPSSHSAHQHQPSCYLHSYPAAKANLTSCWNNTCVFDQLKVTARAGRTCSAGTPG